MEHPARGVDIELFSIEPFVHPRYVRRADASAYVRRIWGVPCSTNWLAKLAVTGGGPIFRKAGRFPIYAIEDLDRWASARISGPLTSTSASPDC